jgi:hypothetical protein
MKTLRIPYQALVVFTVALIAFWLMLFGIIPPKPHMPEKFHALGTLTLAMLPALLCVLACYRFFPKSE